MKYILPFIYCLTLQSIVRAQEKPVKSKVESVLLFSDRALVTRKVDITLVPPGRALFFDRLPGNLDTSSLRAKVSSNKNVNILGIRSKQYQIKKSEVENVEYRKWRKRQDSYNQDMLRKREEAQKLVRENTRLQELFDHYKTSFPYNIHEGNWSDKTFKAFINLSLSRSNKMLGSWSKLFKEYMDLSKKSEFASSKLLELDKFAPKGWNKVWIDVKVKQKVKISIDLEYLVFEANWKPSYAVNFRKNKKKALFHQGALLKQWTGEDWDEAKIVLSNYQSQLHVKAPVNQAHRLTYREVKDVKTSVQGTSRKNKILAASVKNDAVGLQERVNKEFVLKGRHSLKSGLPELKIAINDYELDYENFYEVIPSQMQNVFERATLDNKIGFALAAGATDVYVDGYYLQQFQLPFTPKAKPIKINKGYFYDINVKRLVNNKNGSSGILRNKKEYIRNVTDTITNWSNKEIELRVYEQTPKSETESIEVKIESRPNEFKKDPEFETWGFWSVKLKPMESKIVNLSLTVTAPEELNFKW